MVCSFTAVNHYSGKLANELICVFRTVDFGGLMGINDMISHNIL